MQAKSGADIAPLSLLFLSFKMLYKYFKQTKNENTNSRYPY